MRKTAAVVAVLAMAACGSDSSGPPAGGVPSELAGTWVADVGCVPQCGFTFRSVANPADSLNITSSLAISTEVHLAQGGSFHMISAAGGSVQGTARAQGNMLIVQGGGQADTLDYVLSGGRLQLDFRGTYSTFDLTGDGVVDPARLRGTFVKR